MLTLKLVQHKFNRKDFLAAVRLSARTLRDGAMEEFYRTVLSELPVWSGASKATLIPLGRLIGLSTDISPKVLPPFKDPQEHGIQAGKRKGKAKKINKTNEYGFTFEHTLFHYWLNENFMHNYGINKKPTPWETFKSGSAKYDEYIKNNSNLPNIWTYLETI